MKNEARYVPAGGAMIEISNRTQQGRFLLLPSREANDLILGVLGRAQRIYDVTIFAFVFLSDHYHLLLWVEDAQQLASFMNYVDGNIALELGKLHGWQGKFWHGPYFSAVVNDTPVSQLSRLHYILSNGYDSYCTSFNGLTVGAFGRRLGSPGSSVSTSVGSW